MKTALIMILLSTNCAFYGVAQTATTLKSYILKADSVFLIHHTETNNDLVTFVDDSTGKKLNGYKVIRNGKINTKVVLLSRLVSNSDRVNLADLFSKRPSNNVTYEHHHFMPYHSIIIAKGQNISYIDLCFDCNEYVIGSDKKETLPIHIPTDSMRKIQVLFKQYGIMND
jgi:hypothetical protein